jgi:3-oxoacyl-[acyl-carrier protein] reductase
MTGRPFDVIWAERAAENPARRYGEAAEIGATIAFLCSVHAGFITGQSILVDGGQYPGTY